LIILAVVAKLPAGCDTTTGAVALLLESAALVATTWNVPTMVGAVYNPSAAMLPPAAPSCTAQVTAWFASGGLTLAVNCCVPPVWSIAVAGATVTEVTVADGFTVIVTDVGVLEPPGPVAVTA
jgi:hypothetical protein